MGAGCSRACDQAQLLAIDFDFFVGTVGKSCDGECEPFDGLGFFDHVHGGIAECSLVRPVVDVGGALCRHTQRGGIVSAIDGDAGSLVDRSAVGVFDLVGHHDDFGLTCGQAVERRIGGVYCQDVACQAQTRWQVCAVTAGGHAVDFVAEVLRGQRRGFSCIHIAGTLQQIQGVDGIALVRTGGDCRTDSGCVVGAVDDDGGSLADQSALGVFDLVGEHDGLALSHCQAVESPIGGVYRQGVACQAQTRWQVCTVMAGGHAVDCVAEALRGQRRGFSRIHIAGTLQQIQGVEGIALVRTGGDCRTDGGHVVGAGDGDCNQLRGAVRAGDCDAVDVGLAVHELVVSAVHGVGPHAGAVDAEFAVTVAAGHMGLCGHGGWAVHVADRQGAGGHECLIALAQAGCADTANQGGIIDACQIEDQGLAA